MIEKTWRSDIAENVEATFDKEFDLCKMLSHVKTLEYLHGELRNIKFRFSVVQESLCGKDRGTSQYLWSIRFERKETDHEKNIREVIESQVRFKDKCVENTNLLRELTDRYGPKR